MLVVAFAPLLMFPNNVASKDEMKLNEVMVSVMVSDNMKTSHKPRNRLQKRQRQPSLAWLWPKEVTIHATNRIHSHLSLNDCEAAIAIRPFDFGP